MRYWNQCVIIARNKSPQYKLIVNKLMVVQMDYKMK